MRFAQIRSMDISNGEGIGVSLFVQGCPFHCDNCFNSETWDFKGGREWTDEIKNDFLSSINKPYVKRVSILGGEPLATQNLEEILRLIGKINEKHRKPQILEKSISQNPRKLGVLRDEKSNEIHISSESKNVWLYTGYTVQLNKKSNFNGNSNEYEFTVTESSNDPEVNALRTSIINNVDIIVDGRYIDEQRDLSLKFRGSKNQRVIDVQKSLKEGQIVLYCD